MKKLKKTRKVVFFDFIVLAVLMLTVGFLVLSTQKENKTAAAASPEDIAFKTTTFTYNPYGHALEFTNKGGYVGFVITDTGGKYLAGDMNEDGLISTIDLLDQNGQGDELIIWLPAFSVGTHTLYLCDIMFWFGMKDLPDEIANPIGFVKEITVIINNPEVKYLDKTNNYSILANDIWISITDLKLKIENWSEISGIKLFLNSTQEYKDTIFSELKI